MANVFSGDENCKALWRFESGALTTDSKGSNTLTDYNTVGTDAGDPKEGSANADFERGNAEALYIADGDLDAGFPLKNGDSTKIISACFWIKVESFDPSHVVMVFSKYDTNAKRSFGVDFNNAVDAQRLGFRLGYNSGASIEVSTQFGTDLSIGVWYHVGIVFDDSDKSYLMRIWDDNASDFLDSDLSGNFTNNISIEDSHFAIGTFFANGSPTTPYLDAMLDELVIFSDKLTTGEIDQIRAGTYGAAGSSIPVFMNHYMNH